MAPSISDAAVRGGSTLSDEKCMLLDVGNIDGLLELNRSRFGGFFMMADDDADNDDDADADDDEDGDEDDEDDDDEDDDKGKKKPSAAQRRIDELSAENKRRRVKAREQKAQLDELQKQIDELTKSSKKKGKADDDEDDSDNEESTAKITELESDRKALMSDNEALRIQLAFTSNTKYAWKNPKAALKLADLSDVEIDDDGEVDGLDEALDKLAKSDPYLLKDKNEDDEDDEDDKSRRRRSTGQPTGGSGSRKKSNPNRDKLVSKYPALRR